MNNLYQIVQDWGISEQAADHFHLKMSKSGDILYPSIVGQPGSRKRVMIVDPNPDQGKYYWARGTDQEQEIQTPVLFNQECLKDTNWVILANGEKTVMSLYSAGVKYAVCTFGEGNRLQEAIEILSNANIELIINFPDNDKKGIQSAQKLKKICDDLGIILVQRDLGHYANSHLGHFEHETVGWDLRDLWLYVRGDKPLFFYALWQMIRLEQFALDFMRYRKWLEPPVVRKKLAPFCTQPLFQPNGISIDLAVAHTLWEQKVIQATYQITGQPRHPNAHVHCPNPEHPDEHPSFRFTQRGVPVCTCGKIRWEQLAEWVGIESFNAYVREQVRQRVEQLSKQPLSRYPRGIPNAVRTLIMQLKRGGYVKDQTPALIPLEVWQISDLPHDTPFTINQLMTYADDMVTYPIMLKGMKQLVDLGFAENAESLVEGRGRPQLQFTMNSVQAGLTKFYRNLLYRVREKLYDDVIPDEPHTSWYPGENHEMAIQLATIEHQLRTEVYHEYQDAIEEVERQFRFKSKELMDMLEPISLLNSPSEEVTPSKVWNSASTYRDDFYIARRNHRAERNIVMTRDKIASEMGMRPESLRDIRARTGTATTRQYKEAAINRTQDILKQADQRFPWAANRRFGRYLVAKGEWQDESWFRIETNPKEQHRIETWAEEKLSEGRTLSLHIQIASLEREGTEYEKRDMSERLETRQWKRRILYVGKRRAKQIAEMKLAMCEEDLENALENGRFDSKEIDELKIKTLLAEEEVERVTKELETPCEPNTKLVEASETSKRAFTPKYVTAQRQLAKVDVLDIYAIAKHQASVRVSKVDLSEFSHPLQLDASEGKGYDNQNKSLFPPSIAPPGDKKEPPLPPEPPPKQLPLL